MTEIEKKIRSYFPFQFTDGQQQAVEEIRQDLASGRVMSRLLHSDVGSGKTAVMLYACIGCALQGHRSIIFAPTTILSEQHSNTLKNMGWSDAQLLLAGDEDNGALITIGTHTVLNSEELLASAALVCVDEFSKTGVQQRAKINKSSHLLIVSAVPLPRTLATTVFGDLDVSIIKELPIKRGTVITRQVLPEKREAMYEIIEKELAKGHQAYFVFPRISGGEDVASAERGFEEISERFDEQYSGRMVGLLTGKDSAEMKAKTLREFRSGSTCILVSTIIAEVGLDNPNATVMVIEGADRFGLSQLHQLRGRVCRSTSTAFCFLVSETANPTSIARLEVIEKCNDGFLIAEEDLRLRGCGEVFSTKQTGLPDLKFISLLDDFDLIQEAKELVASGSAGVGPKEMMRIKYDGLLQFGEVV